MADRNFAEYGVPAGFGPEGSRRGKAQRLVQLAGAASSLALVLALGFWGYRLAVRDVSGVPVIRAMPNTPAAVGRGITVCCPNARVTAAQRTLATELLSAVGQVGWVADEASIDAVTAVSGSGPAYVFLLAECLAKAGVAAGLDRTWAEIR